MFVFLTLFILVLTIADIAVPDKDIAEIENKVLSHIPALNTASLRNGTWTKDYGVYVQDQFVMRDLWITAHSALETEVLRKVETGGMLLDTKSGMQYSRLFGLTDTETLQWEKNSSAFAAFCGRHDGITVMFVPSASQLKGTPLPAGAPSVDENALMDSLLNMLPDNVRAIDLRKIMADSSGSAQVFYRNDHHWTTDGAELAYRAFCDEKAVIPDISLRREQPGFMGTSYSKSRWVHAQPDSLVWYDLPAEMTIYQTEGENRFTEKSQGSLYNPEALASYDKYAFFLHGNNGYSRIKGSGEGKILLIKDSFANCFVPFLTESYETTDVIDLRNYQYSPDSLIDSEKYDEILILYGLQTLFTDTSIINLNRPTTIKD